jgi:hypothetical protein
VSNPKSHVSVRHTSTRSCQYFQTSRLKIIAKKLFYSFAVCILKIPVKLFLCLSTMPHRGAEVEEIGCTFLYTLQFLRKCKNSETEADGLLHVPAS